MAAIMPIIVSRVMNISFREGDPLLFFGGMIGRFAQSVIGRFIQTGQHRPDKREDAPWRHCWGC